MEWKSAFIGFVVGIFVCVMIVEIAMDIKKSVGNKKSKQDIIKERIEKLEKALRERGIEV